LLLDGKSLQHLNEFLCLDRVRHCWDADLHKATARDGHFALLA
jgi:hypothetical protein